jgi:hypothetical protein
MSDVDPTPETPVTIGDRLGWWRGDLAARIDVLSQQLATQHAEMLAAIAALAGGVSLAQLRSAVIASTGGGATEATLGQVLAAIGQLDTYPASWTVRALLAALNTAIDTTPTGEPPSSGLNPDPGSCGAGWQFSGRGTMINSGEWADVGGVTCDLWYLESIFVDGLIWKTATAGVMEPDPQFVAAHPDGYVDFCISWDFTGNATLPPQYGMRQSDAENAAGTPYTWIATTTTGSRRVEMRQSDVTRYLAIYFAVPQGSLCPQNVFFHIAGRYPS